MILQIIQKEDILERGKVFFVCVLGFVCLFLLLLPFPPFTFHTKELLITWGGENPLLTFSLKTSEFNRIPWALLITLFI